jgi:predicted  nucleic acid-binding Zn-ribbon protein
MTQPVQTVEELFGCIATQFGIATGSAIKAEIDALLGMPNVDVQALQAAITQIQSLLDSDPNTPGFQIGQNIISQLVSLGDRITALENDTVLASLQTMVVSLGQDLASEVARAQAAEQALQDLIDGLTTQVNTLQTALDNLPTGQGGCDCAALQAQITSINTQITNLLASDAQVAIQISGLQEQVSTLSGQVAAAATAAANAAAAAAAAATAAPAAQATANAAAAAVANLDNRENNHHNEHAGHINGLHAFRDAILGQNCTSLRGMFEAGIALGKAGGY